MRIRLQLTIDVTRKAKAQTDAGSEAAPHEYFESQGSYVEHAAPHPVGFTFEPRQDNQ